MWLPCLTSLLRCSQAATGCAIWFSTTCRTGSNMFNKGKMDIVTQVLRKNKMFQLDLVKILGWRAMFSGFKLTLNHIHHAGKYELIDESSTFCSVVVDAGVLFSTHFNPPQGWYRLRRTIMCDVFPRNDALRLAMPQNKHPRLHLCVNGWDFEKNEENYLLAFLMVIALNYPPNQLNDGPQW